MATRIYKLYATTATAACASIQVIRNCSIMAVAMSFTGTNAGDATGREICELSLNNPSSSIAVNDTPGYSIANIATGSNIAATGSSAEKFVVVGGLPVRAGDKLYLHINTATAATALANRTVNVHVYVSE